jgi:hypothetical protein
LSESETHRTPAAATDYRRDFLPEGSCFFTVDLATRQLALLSEFNDVSRAAFRRVRALAPVYD